MQETKLTPLRDFSGLKYVRCIEVNQPKRKRVSSRAIPGCEVLAWTDDGRYIRRVFYVVIDGQTADNIDGIDHPAGFVDPRNGKLLRADSVFCNEGIEYVPPVEDEVRARELRVREGHRRAYKLAKICQTPRRPLTSWQKIKRWLKARLR